MLPSELERFAERDKLAKSANRWKKTANFFVGSSLTTLLFSIAESNSTMNHELLEKAPYIAGVGIAATIGSYIMEGIRLDALTEVKQQIGAVEAENLNDMGRLEMPDVMNLAKMMSGKPMRDSE